MYLSVGIRLDGCWENPGMQCPKRDLVVCKCTGGVWHPAYSADKPHFVWNVLYILLERTRPYADGRQPNWLDKERMRHSRCAAFIRAITGLPASAITDGCVDCGCGWWLSLCPDRQVGMTPLALIVQQLGGTIIIIRGSNAAVVYFCILGKNTGSITTDWCQKLTVWCHCMMNWIKMADICPILWDFLQLVKRVYLLIYVIVQLCLPLRYGTSFGTYR